MNQARKLKLAHAFIKTRNSLFEQALRLKIGTDAYKKVRPIIKTQRPYFDKERDLTLLPSLQLTDPLVFNNMLNEFLPFATASLITESILILTQHERVMSETIHLYCIPTEYPKVDKDVYKIILTRDKLRMIMTDKDFDPMAWDSEAFRRAEREYVRELEA